MDSLFLTRPQPPSANGTATGGDGADAAQGDERGHGTDPEHGPGPAQAAGGSGATPAPVASGPVLRWIGGPRCASLRRASAAQRGLAAAVLAITLSVGVLAGSESLPGEGPNPATVVPAPRAGEGQPGQPAQAGQPQSAASPAPPAATGQRWRDSGRIGRWQEMGHGASSIAVERRVASTPSGVLLLGDSSLTRARPELLKALAGRPVSWNQWNGRPTAAAVDVAAAIDGVGRLPSTIVLLSGSNDVFFPEGFAYQVERLMAIAGPQRRVVWVAPYVVRPRYAPADEHNSRGLRADLLAASQHQRNLHVVDWSGHVLALDDAARRARMPDGAHPSALGCEELARLIAAVVTDRSR